MTQSPPTGELVARLRSGIVVRDVPGVDPRLAGAPDFTATVALLREAADAITALERELEEAKHIARSLTKALVGLTPSGSEYFVRSTLLDDYFADTDRCVSVIRERYETGHRAKIECVDLRRDLTASQAEVERLKDALGQHERLLLINKVRNAAEEVAPLWLEAADAASDLVRAALQVEESKG